MRIGIIGTRGIPNQHGGFEQFVEFIAPALVLHGHEVYVYNSSLHPFKENQWNGVHIVSKYDPEDKLGTAGQFIYDLNCILDSRKKNFDIILQLGYTSSSIWSFLFPKKSIIITNMDGLEWKRSKYSKKVQHFLTKAERWGAMNSDYLIADSKGIQHYLAEKYNKQSWFIPYGAELITTIEEGILPDRNLEKFSYNLVIARLEPENNVETIILGHLASHTSKVLIIIGGYGNSFGRYLKGKYASKKIQFWGALYDLKVLNSLRFFSNLYFHGHSVGGTNPSLLEAMASCSLIVAHDNIFNKSILEEDAFYFSSSGEITELLNREMKRKEFEYMVTRNVEKIKEKYTWNHIVNLMESLFAHAIREFNDKRK